jgi:hypothetical protein
MQDMRRCYILVADGEVLAHAERACADSGAAVAAQGVDVVGAAGGTELGGVAVAEGGVAAVEDEEEAAERGVERAGGGRAAQQGEERGEAAEAHEAAGLDCSIRVR